MTLFFIVQNERSLTAWFSDWPIDRPIKVKAVTNDEFHLRRGKKRRYINIIKCEVDLVYNIEKKAASKFLKTVYNLSFSDE